MNLRLDLHSVVQGSYCLETNCLTRVSEVSRYFYFHTSALPHQAAIKSYFIFILSICYNHLNVQVVVHSPMVILVLVVDQSSWMMYSVPQLPASY